MASVCGGSLALFDAGEFPGCMCVCVCVCVCVCAHMCVRSGVGSSSSVSDSHSRCPHEECCSWSGVRTDSENQTRL